MLRMLLLKTIKKSFLFYVIILMCILFVSPFTSAKEVFTLKVSTPYPPPNQALSSKYLVTWEKMVTKDTNGHIKFLNYFGGTLGKASEQLSLVSRGIVDVVVSYGWYTPTELPLQDYDYAVPFGPDNPLIITKAMRKVYEEVPAIRKELERHNITRVFQAPGLPEVILSKTPIKSLRDFRGKKIKVIGKYFGRWVSALGMAPVSAPGTEVYTMLQTGVVQMALDPMDLQYAYKNIEQAPYIIEPGLFAPNWISCWINLDTLKRLPKRFQKIILQDGKKLEIKAGSEIAPRFEKFIFSKWLKNPKVRVIKLTNEERREWAEKMPNTALEWAESMEKKGLPGMKILRLYIKYCSLYGHKWIINWLNKK